MNSTISEAFSYLDQEDRTSARELARHIARRDWVLFAGSGISRRSGLPLWPELVERMLTRLSPGGVETKDPLEVASLFEANLGRSTLVDFLKENLQVLGACPNPFHDRLLDLRPPKLVTTNFDDLLERALEQRGIPHALVIFDRELSLIADRLAILKPHGDLKHPDALVFTRRDYARYPRQELVNMTLCSLAAQHSFFFVGYSLSDPDFEHQLQNILDAQGELSRIHYLVVDKINPLRRRAFQDQRKIHVIELGSYGQLERFLVDLQTETERVRLSEETSQPVRSTKNTEVSGLSTTDQKLLEFLQEDYVPVIEALDQLRFADAEERLQRILARIQKVKEDPASTWKAELGDFHQRVLLALAAIAGRRSRYEEARNFFYQAKVLQPFTGRRRLQAAEVLLALGRFEEAETLLAEGPEKNEPRGKEILEIAALFRSDEAPLLSLDPNSDNESLELNIARAHLAVRSVSDATAKDALALLDKAWRSSQDFPLGCFTVAILTDKLLRRIISEEWETPGVDRWELLKAVRSRYQHVLSAFEKVADQYQEGLVAVLSRLLDFRRVLGEEEAQQAILSRLQSFSVITPERPLIEHLAGNLAPSLDVIETLFQKGFLSSCEKALLSGAALTQEGRILEAEQIYRQALVSSESQEDRHALIESLLKLLRQGERYQEAMAFLEEATSPGEIFRDLLTGMLLWARKDREGAIAILRGAVEQHPRNMPLLENLVRLLSRQLEINDVTDPSAKTQGRQADVLAEALCYAEKLETVLPSFEHKVFRANLLRQSGRYDIALQLVEEVEKEGYITLRVIGLKGDLLRQLGRNREVAELFSIHRERYPNNYSIRFNEATAWADVGEIDRAIVIWEELRGYPEADGNLYCNLILAHIQRGALDPSAFSRAFDFAREAVEKFPDRRDFAPLLIQAAQGCGRSKEAWEFIGQHPDLREGPYLRAVPEEEFLEFYTQETRTLQAVEAAYRAGGIPFSTYAARSPRSPLFLWQVRISLWRKHQGGPLLCGFPDITRGFRQRQIPSEGVILDITSVLSLGTLNVAREILGALQRAGRPIFLFPGVRRWLDEEVGRLSLDQMPYYRERHKRLRDQLLTARERVEISPKVDEQNGFLDESTRQVVGIVRRDVELAIGNDAAYVDDYLPQEGQSKLPPNLAISSSDFLAALEKAGVLFPEEVERIRTEHPDPFAKAKTGAPIDLQKPMVFSSLTLGAWFEAGLLDRWLKGDPGWPPKLIVGRVAWDQLKEEVTEDEIYREALQLAVSLRESIAEALDSGLAKELSSIDPPDLGVQPNLRALFDPTLALLAQARAQKLALWSDDICTRLLVDPRGPLLQEQALVEITARVRRTFAEVSIFGTEDVLCWLESIGEFSRERRLSLLWQMHRDGYRFLGVGDVLLWLLERFRYDQNAAPVKELLSDLESVATLALPNVDPKRLRFFTDIYLGDVLSQAIRGLWRSENSVLPDNERHQLSTDLLRLFERVTLQ